MTEREEPRKHEPAKEGEKREPSQEEAPETARHPAPGIEHEPEPSADNLIPAEDKPGTM